MFVTMATDSARNPVCWALGSRLVAMWSQFGPLGAFWSLCLSSRAKAFLSLLLLSLLCLSPAFLWVSPFASFRKQLLLCDVVSWVEASTYSVHPKPFLD